MVNENKAFFFGIGLRDCETAEGVGQNTHNSVLFRLYCCFVYFYTRAVHTQASTSKKV